MGNVNIEKMEVGYWKIRGLGAPLRMMCAFKDEEVTHYAANSGDMWFGAKKPELAARNSLINLPFIVDGEQVITQSNSCMLYLGQKLQIDAEANAIRNHQRVLISIFGNCWTSTSLCVRAISWRTASP